MNIILGSRTFAPLSDVTATDGDICFGTSDVSLTAESLGAERRPLEANRKTLLEAARNGSVVLYCSRDPETKQVTEGMAAIQRLLTSNDIEFRVVSSPFSGEVCALLTNLRHATDAVVKAATKGRRDYALGKALGYAGLVVEKRDEIMAKLSAGWDFEVGKDELDARFIRWLHTYQALCDGLEDSERMLA